MEHDEEESEISNLIGNISIAPDKAIIRYPGIMKVAKKLMSLNDLGGSAVEAVKSRLDLYRTGNIIAKAKQISEATGLPLQSVSQDLIRQSRLDSIALEAISRVSNSYCSHENENVSEDNVGKNQTSERWFSKFYDEASVVNEQDEKYVKEKFVRILTEEIKTPGSFSIQTLQILGSINQWTAKNYVRAASVSISQCPVPFHQIFETRIPSLGGKLGQNYLQDFNLNWDVLINLTENGLLNPDYDSWREFNTNLHPFKHQGKMWKLTQIDDTNSSNSLKVNGGNFTTCGIELLKIVDIEPMPKFTNKLSDYFNQSGYRMEPYMNHF